MFRTYLTNVWCDMPAPQFLAVGDVQGIVHIMEIPRSLRRATYKEKPALKNFMIRQQAWVVDVEARAEGRGAEIAKRQAIRAVEEQRQEEFFKTCTWDEQAEEEYLKFEEECRQRFKSRKFKPAPLSPPDSP